MRILIEEHKYAAQDVKDILHGIDALESVDGYVSLSYVGYFYNTLLKDCVFILPKVLVDEKGLVFSKYSPERIINTDIAKIDDKERAFLYEFAVWIYRAIDVYRHSHKNSDIIYHRKISQVGRGQRKRTSTLLDIVLSLILFNKENKSFVTFVLKNMHSGYNKINWTKTISHSPVIIQNGEAVYMDLINKKRQINFDEELLVIFFSILNYIHETYGFAVDIHVGFPLIRGEKFKSYMKGRGAIRLRQIKYKYFSDKALELWNLCYAFFAHHTKITTSTELKEYLLAKNFYVVFEAIIDELIGDNKEDLPTDFKEQKDGKLVDHLYTYPGLIEADEEQRTYYIGDSKYYKLGATLGTTSIYKQYTYARNIVQYNIDLWLNSNVPNPDIKLRDDVTEGYNIIPNFFISASMTKDDYSYSHREIVPTDTSGKSTEIKYQFEDRLFDRDTMLLSRYNVNFLFVVALYARNRQAEKAAWKEEVRKQFRDEIRKVLENEYCFYPMRSKGVSLEEYMTKHFRQLNGKVFTPFTDKTILTLALHAPKDSKGCRMLANEQRALLEMLHDDFNIDDNYNLGAEPKLPPAVDFIYSPEDYVMIGYLKSDKQLQWVLKEKKYNVRSGSDPGSLNISPSVCAARYLLLYGRNGEMLKFALEQNKTKVWSKEMLERSGYCNPSHDFYIVFSIEKQINDGDFGMMKIDRYKLKALLNRYNKDNAGHDKGAEAVRMSELVSCKI